MLSAFTFALKYEERAEESFKTTCSYCGVGCGIVVKKDRKGKYAGRR